MNKKLVKALLLLGIFTWSPTVISQTTGILTDSRDGKSYRTVTIGSQVWMAENLNYNPGSGSWVYDNDPENAAIYGRLYNWKTAIKICPDGWHLPCETEWNDLTDYLGGEGVAGGKLKESGTSHWDSPNVGATNSIGFFALPGGYRGDDGIFRLIGFRGNWWSCVENTSYPLSMYIHHFLGNVYRTRSDEDYGLSVRCVQD